MRALQQQPPIVSAVSHVSNVHHKKLLLVGKSWRLVFVEKWLGNVNGDIMDTLILQSFESFSDSG